MPRGDGLVELRVDGQGVAGEDGDAHAGAGDLEVRQAENLAGFVAQLLLFVGLVAAVIDEVAGKGQRVISDGRNKRPQVLIIEGRTIVDQVYVVIAHAVDLRGECLHARQAGSGYRLVGRYVQLVEAGGIVQDLQHRHGGHGGAVRVGDDALRRVLRLVRVYLRYHERNLWILAVGRRIIHHGSARGSEDRGPLLRGGTARGKYRDIDISHGFFGDLGQVLHFDLLAAEFQLGSGGAGGGEKAHLIRREIAFFQNGAHHAADLAGGADDCNGSHCLPLYLFWFSVRFQHRRWLLPRRRAGIYRAGRAPPFLGPPRASAWRCGFRRWK